MKNLHDILGEKRQLTKEYYPTFMKVYKNVGSNSSWWWT